MFLKTQLPPALPLSPKSVYHLGLGRTIFRRPQ